MKWLQATQVHKIYREKDDEIIQMGDLERRPIEKDRYECKENRGGEGERLVDR